MYMERDEENILSGNGEILNKREDREEKEVKVMSMEDTLKEKYPNLYKITAQIVIDDDDNKEVEYFFRKPFTASFDRYIRTASKGMTKALKVFMQDNIVKEQEESLDEDLEKYPALALSVGQKLLEVLGYSDNVNLKKL